MSVLNLLVLLHSFNNLLVHCHALGALLGFCHEVIAHKTAATALERCFYWKVLPQDWCSGTANLVRFGDESLHKRDTHNSETSALLRTAVPRLCYNLDAAVEEGHLENQALVSPLPQPK